MYGEDYLPNIVIEREPTPPLVTVFDDLIRLSMYSDKALSSTATNHVTFRETFVQCLTLLRKLASQLQSSGENAIIIPWQPDEWLLAVVQSIQSEVVVYDVYLFHKPTVTVSDYSIHSSRQRHFNRDHFAPNHPSRTEIVHRQEEYGICVRCPSKFHLTVTCEVAHFVRSC